MLIFKLISGRRVWLTCGQGGGECRGGAEDIANFITFCRVNRELKRRTNKSHNLANEKTNNSEHERANNVVESKESHGTDEKTATVTPFDIFPAILADESKFYPKHYDIY